MALTQSTTIFGLQAPNAYYNIQEARSSKMANGVFLVELVVNEYTDSTKENHISQSSYRFESIQETDLNYSNYYTLLKTLDVFSNATDA